MAEKVNIAGIVYDIGNTKEKKTGSWRSRMPIVDKERCTGCSTCVRFCPEECMALNNDRKVTIDYNYCKGCGICANECPVKCISMKDDQCAKEVCKKEE